MTEGGGQLPPFFYNLIKSNQVKKKELKDRIYVLKGGTAPLSFMLASRHTRRHPLLHFDEKTHTNRELRYARNQGSPFVDEQDDNAIIEPIVFEDGSLMVPKSNIALQDFLSYHPANGQKFEEKDEQVEVAEELSYLQREVDALSVAKDLDINMMEMICRVGMGSNVDAMTSAELKRDVFVYARNNPTEFLDLIEDPRLEMTNFVSNLMGQGHLGERNNGREIFYNLKNNKKRLMTVPFGEDPKSALIAFFQSDEGLEAYEYLKKISKK